MQAPPSLLDEVLPRFDAGEEHELLVPARPEVVFAAVKEVTVRDVRLLTPLMALRGLPRLVTGRPGFRPERSAPVLDAFLEGGFVLLGERPGAEIAAGAIGRFWRPLGNAPGLGPATRRRRASRERRQSRRHRDPRCRHEPRGDAGLLALLARDPPRQRRDPPELAGRDPSPGRSRGLVSRVGAAWSPFQQRTTGQDERRVHRPGKAFRRRGWSSPLGG